MEYMRAILSFHSFLSPMELIIIFVTMVGKTKSKLLELLLPTKILNQSHAANLKKLASSRISKDVEFEVKQQPFHHSHIVQ